MAIGTIVINDDLRTMQIPASITLLGVESDDDVNRIEFQMPKMYGSVDLSSFEARINYMNANGDGDLYIADDLAVDGENMTFSWLVGRNACAYKGKVSFIVCLKKFNSDSVVIQEFNTTVYNLPVLEGLETTEAVVQQNPDIIEYILTHMSDGSSEISATAAGKIIHVVDDEIDIISWNFQKNDVFTIQLAQIRHSLII